MVPGLMPRSLLAIVPSFSHSLFCSYARHLTPCFRFYFWGKPWLQIRDPQWERDKINSFGSTANCNCTNFLYTLTQTCKPTSKLLGHMVTTLWKKSETETWFSLGHQSLMSQTRSLNNRNWFPGSCRGSKSKIKAPEGSVSGEASLGCKELLSHLIITQQRLCGERRKGRGQEASSVLSPLTETLGLLDDGPM